MSLTNFSNCAQRKLTSCFLVLLMSFFNVLVKWLLQLPGSRKIPPHGDFPTGKFPPSQFLNSSNASILIITVNTALICYEYSLNFELFNEILSSPQVRSSNIQCLCPESNDKDPMPADAITRTLLGDIHWFGIHQVGIHRVGIC